MIRDQQPRLEPFAAAEETGTIAGEAGNPRRKSRSVAQARDEQTVITLTLRCFASYISFQRKLGAKARRRLKTGTPKQRAYARETLQRTSRMLQDPVAAVRQYDQFLNRALRAVLEYRREKRAGN